MPAPGPGDYLPRPLAWMLNSLARPGALGLLASDQVGIGQLV